MKLRTITDLTLEPLDLAAFIADIKTDLSIDAEAKGQRIEVQVETVEFVADPHVLRSAVTNLLHNAMKFSPDGATIRFRAGGADAQVTIEVEDECGGLPPGKLEALFDPFVQASGNRSGFGLGLAITKQAAEVHGGAVRVHDLPGRGCVFVLSLPQRPVTHGARGRTTST